MIMASRLKLVIINFFKKHRIPIFFIALAAIVLPEITVYFHRPNRGFDIYGYLNAGNDALKLENLYRISEPGKNNTWPPFFSFFCVPLALSQKFLGLPVTKELWYFFNFMAFILAMQMISLLLYKKKPSFLPGNDRFDFTSDLVFVPFFLILPGFIKNFFMLQINMFVLFLVIAGFFFYTRERNWVAGLFFGLAASIKAFPGLFLIYFLLRKQWRVSGAILLWAIGFTVSPVLFYGIERFSNLMIEWMSISFFKPFIVGYHSYLNQSLYAFWERLLAHQVHITQAGSMMIKSANYLSIITISIIVFSSILSVPYKKLSISGFIEFSMICVMMMLFPPIAWEHYWVLLLPATASAYYCLKKMPQVFTTAVKSLFVTYIILTAVPYIFSKSAITYFLKMHSSGMFSGLVLLFALVILHRNINLAAVSD
jgi:hypothetical protein